ncbi:MAG: glutamate-5-semialdehyde dehydrogenase [Myxococcota bacterium]|jgi:glutamate-5-semialdehyde dehydrogenase
MTRPESEPQSVENRCLAAKNAQPHLVAASTATKNAVLSTLAQLLVDGQDDILKANQQDLAAARERGLSAALVDRLTLTPARLASIADGVRDIAALPDPVGEIGSLERRPNGLQVGRMRIPLGVVAMIFESRPNIVIDAGALCLKSGNACILKGGSEASHSNEALVNVLWAALESQGLPRQAAVLLTDRGEVAELLKQDGSVDLVIPRGGEGLIRYVTENSRIPVVQHFKGVCHVYVDEGAEHDMAAAIVLNGKAQRPGVCNATETVLVHGAEAETFVHRVVAELQAAGVEVRGCERTIALTSTLASVVQPATPEDWDTEYLDLVISVRVVDDFDAAVAHIRAHGSDHTETIVTQDYRRAHRFISLISSSCVIVNASTRFNDGSQLGLGAEIGISTSRLHAFGPMGLKELTTTKFVIFGDGQIRS